MGRICFLVSLLADKHEAALLALSEHYLGDDLLYSFKSVDLTPINAIYELSLLKRVSQYSTALEFANL